MFPVDDFNASATCLLAIFDLSDATVTVIYSVGAVTTARGIFAVTREEPQQLLELELAG